MKKFIISLSFVAFINTISAQDLIIKKDGSEIETKVIEVGIDIIKYKKFDNQDGPVYSLEKEDVFMIRYGNGSKDVFNNEHKEPKDESSDTIQISREGLYLVNPYQLQIGTNFL